MTLATYEEVVDAEIVPDEITRQEARELTDRIRVGLDAVWNDVAEAYTRVAHKALGYDSWDDYCATEFGSSRIKLPKENRPEQIRSMFEQGVSIKAIVTATGVARNTVRNDLRQGGQFDPPAKQLGQDGKTYTRPEPTVSERGWPEVPEPTPERDSMTVALINDLRGPWRRGITSTAKKMTEKERQILIEAIEITLEQLKEI